MGSKWLSDATCQAGLGNIFLEQKYLIRDVDCGARFSSHVVTDKATTCNETYFGYAFVCFIILSCLHVVTLWTKIELRR